MNVVLSKNILFIEERQRERESECAQVGLGEEGEEQADALLSVESDAGLYPRP